MYIPLTYKITQKPIKLAHCLCVLIFVAILSSCASNQVEQLPSSNQNTRIKALVMHFTALDYADSLTALVDEGGLSSHYLVPESNDSSYPYSRLKVFQLVDEQARAWHAGTSYWQGMSGLNDQSIGIEVVNIPACKRDLTISTSRAEHTDNRLCIFPDYDPKQIELVIKLSQDILARNPDIHPTAIVGHADIAPSRKNDPGPRFPWYQLYNAGVGAWYEKPTLNHYWQQFNQTLPSISITQAALAAYGYRIIETGVYDQQTRDVLSAFQMHFTPWQVTGENDSHTNAAVFALLQKYFPERVERLNTRFQIEADYKPSVFTKAQVGQIDKVFPEQYPSDRQFVNNRVRFKTYQGQGSISISNLSSSAINADIYINGSRLNLHDPFVPDQQYQFSLSKRTQSGTNLLSVQNIEPQEGALRIQIPYPTLSKAQADSYDFSSVDTLITNDVKNGFPGAVLVVIKQGQIVKQTAYGFAKRFASDGSELSKPAPMTTDTLFDVASNTKTFATTLAVMKLLETQQLVLDRPIYHYLPEYRGDGRESRTVRDLLNHTSGYGPEVRFFDDSNRLGSQFYSQDPEQTKHLLLTQVPFTHGRGLRTQYSDTNFMLLGILIERISGLALDEFVESQIYKPLGLTDTLFNPKSKLPENTRYAATELNGNTRNGAISFPNARTDTLYGEVHDEKSYYSMGGVSGHAGLFSTAGDLAILAQTLLNGGGYGDTHLFSSSLVNQFSHPSNGDFSVGLGFRRAANGQRRWQFGPYASEQAYGHTGWTGTLTVIDPEHDIAIILLTNMRHSEVRNRVSENGNKQIDFAAKQFETGKYGSVVSLIYESLLKKQ